MKRILLTIVLSLVTIPLLFSMHPTDAKAVCTSHTTKQCVSNVVYWYNSCGVLEDVYQNCNKTNQACQNGTCVEKQATTTTPTTTTNPTVTTPTATNTTNTTTTTANNQNTMQNGGLTLIMFAEKESSPAQWVKTITASTNDKIDFLIMVKNTSSDAVNNISIKSDATNTITYASSIKVDNTEYTGNIGSGINVSSMAAKSSMLISFSGTVTLPANQTATTQITANASVGSATYDSDYITINTVATPTFANTTVAPSTTGSSSSTTTSATTTTTTPTANTKSAVTSTSNFIISWIWSFLAHWYIWVIIIILIVLFVIIYKKLSSNT